MFNLDAQLLEILSENEAPTLLFARPDNIERLTNSVPLLAASFAEGWEQRAFWATGEIERLKLADAVAVCSSPLFDLPAASTGVLSRAGVRTVLYFEGGKWNELKLSSTLALLRGKTKAGAAALRRKSIISIRKALLKQLGTDIRSISTNGIAPETGLGYYANVPSLKDYADAVTGAKQGILFFEEEKLLLPHQPHAEIRERGFGRCSLWVENFYFSATDNSDPRTNGRRYRFIKSTPLIERMLRTLPADAAQQAAKSAAAGTATGHASPVRRALQADFQKFVSSDNDSIRAADAALGSGTVAVEDAGEAQTRLAQAILQAFGADCSKVTVGEANEPVSGLSLKLFPSKRALKALGLVSSIPGELATGTRILFSELVRRRPLLLLASESRAAAYAAIAGLLAGVPNIQLFFSGLNPSYTDPQAQDQMKFWLQLAALSPRVCFAADSESAAQNYADWLEIPRVRFALLPLALPEPNLEPVSPQQIAELRAKAGASPESALLAGDFPLTSEQRPFRFLRLVHSLRAELPELRGVLCGQGPLRSMCEKEIENLGLEHSVFFAESAAETRTALAAADVAVFPAAPEVLPAALIEAMLRGKAVVCTDVGEVRQLIEDGLSGCLSGPSDFHSLKARTLDLIEHPEMRTALGANAERIVREKIASCSFAAKLKSGALNASAGRHLPEEGKEKRCA